MISTATMTSGVCKVYFIGLARAPSVPSPDLEGTSAGLNLCIVAAIGSRLGAVVDAVACRIGA